FTSLKDELRWFRELLDRQRRLRVFTWDLESYMFALQDVLMVAVEFAVFYVAIYAWAEGRLTIGTLVLIQTYLFQAFMRLWDFGRVVRAMYRHLADAEEMVETLHTPHEIQDKPKARKLTVKAGQVEFRDVSFTYSRTREVIKRLDLTIAPKEKVGLVGPSGAGKSTIVALIFRFFDVASGGIYIDGTNITDVTQESLRSQLSLVPQDPVLFHRTLFENIRYGRRTATNKEVLEAAHLAHCDDFIARLPDGYNTYVGERGIKLSGGERQRVAIARAILKDAPILVLDEATSSLDSHSEAMIQDALKTLMRGKTTIVIAHRLSTIMNMDRIVVIGDGQVRETGTHRRLLENSGGLYKQLWELQAGGFIADRAGAGK
ncbi:MAG: ABC transporter ATP-binding protein, partial [bacterium]|nr:ABC transporter ATP-binding protein [bacterium]